MIQEDNVMVANLLGACYSSVMNYAPSHQYSVYLQPLPEGGFNVIVPAIPEICTFGETLEEAKANAKEAIECVLESALKRHETVPLETHSWK